MEVWNIIIPAVITGILGLMGIVLTYFLTKKHYQIERIGKLEDRDFERRAEIWDMRIQEARDTIAISSRYIFLISQFEEALREKQNMMEVDKVMNDYIANCGNLDLMKIELLTKMRCIELLNDKELTTFYEGLFSKIELPLFGLKDILDNIHANRNFDNRQANIKGFQEAFWEASRLIVKIEARIDKLAEKVP